MSRCELRKYRRVLTANRVDFAASDPQIVAGAVQHKELATMEYQTPICSAGLLPRTLRAIRR
jgi:hypothetical protein